MKSALSSTLVELRNRNIALGSKPYCGSVSVARIASRSSSLNLVAVAFVNRLRMQARSSESASMSAGG